MSMSQEEIESLMNGIDIGDDEASAEVSEETSTDDSTPMSEDDIANLIAQTDEIKSEESSEADVSEAAIDEILNDIPDESIEDSEVSQNDIDKLLNEEPEVSETPEVTEEVSQTENVSTDDIDALMASIDSMDENEEETTEVSVDASDLENLTVGASAEKEKIEEPAVEALEQESSPEAVTSNNTELDNDDIEDILAKLEEEGGMVEESKVSEVDALENAIPMPSDRSTKVVDQLSQVAHDSEEKAVKILDVLSSVMDDNDDSIKHLNKFDNFIQSQTKLLETLTEKFPNVEQFSENLEMINDLKDEPSSLVAKLETENNNLLSAMELMQYHDINRQKIERVMSVIRKLSLYLNDIFEDSESHVTSTPVAKHIHGDDSNDLIGNDDLESLISEFGN